MNKRKYITDETPTIVDYKNNIYEPVINRRVHKPLGLMKGFCIAVVYAAFAGFVIGCVLTAIRTGHL